MTAIESFIKGHSDLDLESLKELNIMLAAIEYLSLSVGGLLLIISLTGLFASCYQSKLVLSLFAGALTVPILAKLALFGLTFVFYPNIDSVFTAHVKDYAVDVNKKTQFTEFIDTMQSSMKCCGWTSFREYESGYPPSCCSAYSLDPENIRQISSWTCTKPFTIACEEAAFGVLKWIILTTIIAIIVEIAAASLAISLIRKPQNQQLEYLSYMTTK